MSDNEVNETNETNPKRRRGRPAGKTPRPYKTTYKVDKFRSELSKEDCDEFDNWVSKFRPSLSAIHRYLKDLGYEGSMTSITTWYENTYPVGQEAIRLNALARGFGGLNPYQMLEMSLTRTVNALEFIMAHVQQTIEHRPELILEMDLTNAMRQIPGLAKEIRATGMELANFKSQNERQEIELAGAFAVVEELEALFFDQPALLEPIREACRGAIAKIEGK